jgi:hypothetical protein
MANGFEGSFVTKARIISTGSILIIIAVFQLLTSQTVFAFRAISKAPNNPNKA